MRGVRRSAVKKRATGKQWNGYQRGTTDKNMDGLARYQRVINSHVEAKAEEGPMR
jgi:hypothetical protein